MADPNDLDREDWLRAADLRRKRMGPLLGPDPAKLDKDDWLYMGKATRRDYFLGPDPSFRGLIYLVGTVGLGWSVWYIWNHFSYVWQVLISFVR